MAKSGNFFCTPQDDISLTQSLFFDYEQEGYCCGFFADYEQCADSGVPLEGIQCSRTVPDTEMTEADIGIFMTYEVGMRS